MARKKTRVVPVPLETELAEIAKRYAKSQSELKKIEAQAEKKISTIRKEAKDKAAEYVDEAQECEEAMEAYAIHYQKSKFNKKRSMELGSVTIGFRLGTPKVVKLTRDTWAKVSDKLKEHLPQFIRTKEEPNKDAMIEARNNAELMTKLEMFGVSVSQEDSFFVEFKEEDLR